MGFDNAPRFMLALVLAGLPLISAPVAAQAVPPPPRITASDPPSPANDRMPRLFGEALESADVVIFSSIEACVGRDWSKSYWSGRQHQFSTYGIQVVVADDSVTTFSAFQHTAQGESACSEGFAYRERSTPSIDASSPASPSGDNAPLLSGEAAGNDDIEIYTTLEACQAGTGRLRDGTGSRFSSPGIEVSVPNDSVTTFYARGRKAYEGTSSCSSGFVYEERTTPRITSSNPPSPANDMTPVLRGDPGGSQTIQIFTDPAQCRDGVGPHWLGQAETFRTDGIEVLVMDDTVTTFYARGYGDPDAGAPFTDCSIGFTYEERSSLAPPAPSRRKDCVGQKATILGTEDNDVIYGTAGNDIINGLGGNDEIYGLEGNDLICGGLGHDRIHGGPGNDRIAGDFIAATERAGNDTIYGNEGDDILVGDLVDAGPVPITGGNDLIYGGPGGDVIKGDSLGFTREADERTGGDDQIYGEGGADFLIGDGIEGGAGDDRITGGDDTLAGGPGNDRLRGDELIGGAGADMVTGGRDSLNGMEGDDSLRGDDFDSTGDDAADTFIGGNDWLFGAAGNDVLEGDYIPGGPGDDQIVAGDDRLIGGLGDDLVFGDAVFGEAGLDNVQLGRDTIAGSAGNDRLFGDEVTGVELFEPGRGGNDSLRGEEGDDTLDCQEGFDIGDGGDGTDTQQRCEVALGVP